MSKKRYSELNAIKGLRDSDEVAFEYIYHHYFDRLYQYVFRYLKDGKLAEELVQETMLILWEKRETLDERYAIGSFLYTVAKRLSLNSLRKIANSEIAKQELWMRIETFKNETEETLRVDELQAILEKTLNTLPTQQERVFRLSKLEGYSHEEIASELNISKNTVRNHLFVALKSIRQQFQQYNIPYSFLLFVLL